MRKKLRSKEHRLLHRLPETTTSSDLAAGLHKLMPNTAWDADAVQVLWSECRSIEPLCIGDIILQQVAKKLIMKGWNRIRNPVGFLLVSIPRAVQSVSNAARLNAQAQVLHERVSAEREAKVRLQCERELATWKVAERAFEALPQDRKQDLVVQERRHLLREHPEYGIASTCRAGTSPSVPRLSGPC